MAKTSSPSGSAKNLNADHSCFTKSLSAHLFFHTNFKSRQTFARAIAPLPVHHSKEARSVMKYRNFGVTTM
jgi:hypothetical protein